MIHGQQNVKHYNAVPRLCPLMMEAQFQTQTST